MTATSERYSALAMVEVLNRYLEKMSQIILRHGGSIDKFMGDSIMALFGAPEAIENDIEAALRCAIEMQQAMQAINAVNHRLGMAPLFMGIGINTGEVVAGHLGSQYHSEYTVIGDEVNLTSRVEAHRLRGQILLSEKIYQQARDARAARRCTHRPARAGGHAIRFQALDGVTALPRWCSGRIVDISYGGLYIRSQVPLAPFCDVKMTLALSLLVPDQADVYGKVLRVTEVTEGFECRIEFTAIDPLAQQALKEFVDRLVQIR